MGGECLCVYVFGVFFTSISTNKKNHQISINSFPTSFLHNRNLNKFIFDIYFLVNL